MNRSEMERLAKLGFDDFRARAGDPSLNRYQKIGALDEFRRGKEEGIFEDVLAKLPALREERRRVLDIGCGCSDLPHLLIDWCEKREHELVLLDSQEMLALLPDRPRAALRPAASRRLGSGDGRMQFSSEAIGLASSRRSSPPPNSLPRN